MPSAPDLSQRQAEPTFRDGSSDSQAVSVASDAVETHRFSRCRAALRRTRVSVERGATAVEYALMVGLVAVGIVTAVTALKEKTVDSLSRTAASTSGLVFDAAVKSNTLFTVKFIRNDLGAGGFAVVSTSGSTAEIGSRGVLTQTAGDTQFVANLTSPTTPGIYEVQIRKSGSGPGALNVIEFGRLRVY
jgi:Flp pilus assembly pilin Flp